MCNQARVPLREDAIPTLEELLLFKLNKFTGKDPLDTISLLTVESIDFKYLKKRIPEFDLSRLIENIDEFEYSQKYLYKRWEKWHFCQLRKSMISILDTNLSKLKNIINDYK